MNVEECVESEKITKTNWKNFVQISKGVENYYGLSSIPLDGDRFD